MALEVTLIEKLRDLHKQATTERSHYYVAKTCEEAIAGLEGANRYIQALQEAIQAEGYTIMVDIRDLSKVILEK